MPVTPYHFGPSGFIGLLLRKWIDLPVFVLANVIIDIEVLLIRIFDSRYPFHRYAHTLLIGGLIGAVWGLSVYPFRNLIGKMMKFLRLPYKPSLIKMIISGTTGAWLHVLVDAFYHPDVKLFWPSASIQLWRLSYRHVSKNQIEAICVFSLIAALIFYACLVIRKGKSTILDKKSPK